MYKQRMTIIHNNSYELGSKEYHAYDQGWCDGYDSNEEEWIRRTLPIVGELEESIRSDWESNGVLQVKQIKMIFDAYHEFAPEHEWLRPLVKDALELVHNEEIEVKDYELEDLKFMAKSLGIPVTHTWQVEVSWQTTFEVEALNEDEATSLALNKLRDDYSIHDVAWDAEIEVEDID
jgi:hypothetical protein